jgi:putative peptide zinc metalloprotease protein
LSITEPAPAVTPPAAESPLRRADGIELVGEYKDSGFKTAPWIVRRSDGQVIQLPRLLYLIAEQADGQRSNEEIGAHVSEATKRGVDADAVALLADNLRSLGVLTAPDGSSPPLQKADPLLGLKFRTGVVPERVTGALTTVFKPLFHTPIVALVVLGLLAADVWLLGMHGISPGLRAVIYHPALLLFLMGGVVLATAFHEIGHASACRFGGAKPGVMGVGIYIVWPAFYTDVTDAYRLSKRGRLRTDLGGIYFNAIFALVATGLFALTGFEPLLLLVLIQNFAMIQQLLPLIRLDGYYIISDLTGVPDMFSRIKPVLQSFLPGREADEKVTELKPWVRRVVTTYVLIVVPLLVLSFVLMILHAPRAFATAYDSIGVQWDKVSTAGSAVAGIAGALQLAALVLPSAGIALTLARVGRRAGSGAWSWSAGDPVRRGAVATVAAAGVGLAAFTWWPNGDYRPIQPGERGTVTGGLQSIVDIPSGRPALSAPRAQELGGAPSERDVLHGKMKRNPVASGPTEKKQGRAPAAGATPTAEPTTTPTASATPRTRATATPTPTPSAATGNAAPQAPAGGDAAPQPPAGGTATPAATTTATATPTATPTATATATATITPTATPTPAP